MSTYHLYRYVHGNYTNVSSLEDFKAFKYRLPGEVQIRLTEEDEDDAGATGGDGSQNGTEFRVITHAEGLGYRRCNTT